MNVLVIDVGGTHVKLLATGQQEPTQLPSGKSLTPARLVEQVRTAAAGWEYDAVSLGYPAHVDGDGPREEAPNLGPGWVGFDFAAALGKPIKVVNDAALQALGSYDGGRMLFLGLGTGLGSALVSEGIVVPLELGRLPHCGEEWGILLGKARLKEAGRAAWQGLLEEAVRTFKAALVADYVVLGGGNAEKVDPVPGGARLGGNHNALTGGFRLWEDEVSTTRDSHPAKVWKVAR